MNVQHFFETLRSELGLSASPAECVTLTGADPIYPLPFRIGEGSAAVLALQGIMMDALRMQQSMEPQQIALDFTHVIAGPTAPRGLAQTGADVLHISSPHRPCILPFDVDANHGKRNVYLDSSVLADHHTAAWLVSDGDMFVQSYHPDALGRYDLSVPEMVALNPHLIAVNLNYYGHTGPWKNCPGFEQQAHICTGMAMAQGEHQIYPTRDATRGTPS